MSIKNTVLHERSQKQENMCCDSIYMKFKAGKINYGNKNQNRGCLSVCACWGWRVAMKGRRKGGWIQGPEGTLLCEGNIV